MTKIVYVIAFLLVPFSAFSQVSSEAFTFDTNVRIVNGSTSQIEKIRAAEDLIKRVIATQAFKDQVLNYAYKGKKTYVDNEGFTNEEIYNKMLAGAEELNRSSNNTMDIEVEIYTNSWTSTVGYTYPDSPRIYVNTKFFNSYTPANVAGNLTHEWLHKLGFGHASSYSVSRDSSVPYAIGYIMEKIAGNITKYENEAPAPVTLTPVSALSLTNTGSKVSLKWNSAKSSAGLKEYKVFRRLEGSTTAYLQGRTTGLTFTQSGPSKNAIYYVRAVDVAGNTAKSSEVKFTKVALSAVTNLVLTTTSKSVILKWSAASSSAGIKEYKIFRRRYGSSTAYLQSRTSRLTYSQTKPSTSATYYVKAVDVLGKEVKSVEVKFTK